MYSQNQKEEFARFMESLPSKTDDELAKLCDQFIWLSAYAANNPRSNYHRMCDACYDECQKRNRSDIYRAAYKRIEESL